MTPKPLSRKRMPKPISLKDIEAQAARYVSATRRREKALREYADCPDGHQRKDRLRALAGWRADTLDGHAHALAVMVCRWVAATNPLRTCSTAIEDAS
jgi:hypothetical protein